LSPQGLPPPAPDDEDDEDPPAPDEDATLLEEAPLLLLAAAVEDDAPFVAEDDAGPLPGPDVGPLGPALPMPPAPPSPVSMVTVPFAQLKSKAPATRQEPGIVQRSFMMASTTQRGPIQAPPIHRSGQHDHALRREKRATQIRL